MTILFGVTACGYKGKLKSPTQIEAAEAKKAKKKAQQEQFTKKDEQEATPPAKPLPTPPSMPGETHESSSEGVTPPEGK